MRLMLIQLLAMASLANLAFPSSPKAGSSVHDLVNELGGSIHPASNQEDGWDIGFQVMGKELDDEGLAKLSEVQGIVVLNLGYTQITDAGMGAMGKHTSLRYLHLTKTTLTDAGLPQLSNLQKLEYLNLYGTKVSDKSIPHLTKLKNLRKLFIGETEITDKGIAKLKAAIPGIEVIGGVDMTKLPKSPKQIVEKKVVPKVNLQWNPVKDVQSAPLSYPGMNTTIIFENQSGQPLEIHWVSYQGGLVKYGNLAPGAKRIQNTYSKASWLILKTNGEPTGYFVATKEVCRAIIPKF